jgi:hypothetical protein
VQKIMLIVKSSSVDKDRPCTPRAMHWMLNQSSSSKACGHMDWRDSSGYISRNLLVLLVDEARSLGSASQKVQVERSMQ